MKVRLFSLLAFFLAFGLVATVVRSILPESGKYAWYLRQGQSSVESDKVVFIGSSHIYRQLDPDQFEKEIASLGGELQAFNLGLRGAHLSETTYFAHRVLQDDQNQLRWLVVEAFPMYGGVSRENDFAKRQVDWHDLTRSLDCGFALWQHWLRRPSPAFLLKQVIDAVRHTRFFAKRFTNAGAASDFLAMLGRSTQMPIAGHQEIVGHQGRGFSPLQGRSFDEQALSRFASLQTKRRKSEMLATAMPASAKSPSAPIELERVVARLEASAAQKGVSILWFIHAGAGESDWHSLQQQGVIQHLIDFSDPTLSSEWYGEEFRYDYGHLNWEGAKKMTSIVARKIHSLDSSN